LVAIEVNGFLFTTVIGATAIDCCLAEEYLVKSMVSASLLVTCGLRCPPSTLDRVGAIPNFDEDLVTAETRPPLIPTVSILGVAIILLRRMFLSRTFASLTGCYFTGRTVDFVGRNPATASLREIPLAKAFFSPETLLVFCGAACRVKELKDFRLL